MICIIMKQKLRYLIGLFIVVAIVVVGMKFLANRGTKRGVLKVDSNPTTSIFLGNKHIGRSPFEDKVDSGEQTIRLVPESTTQSLSTWQGNISVSPNLLTYVNATLSDSEFTTAIDILWLEKISSKQSEISVTSNPDGATVILDGDTKGVSPLSLTTIPVGDHTLTVSSAGFLARTLKVKTTAGYKLIANIKLALSSVDQQPAEATPSPALSTSPSPTSKTTPKTTPTPTKTKVATSSATTTQDPAKPFVLIKDTPTGFLNVRSEPKTGDNIVGKVNPGEKYTILDSSAGWYQISYNGTDKGWVAGQYTEKVE
jgi:hypothetical protein